MTLPQWSHSIKYESEIQTYQLRILLSMAKPQSMQIVCERKLHRPKKSHKNVYFCNAKEIYAFPEQKNSKLKRPTPLEECQRDRQKEQ